jgi:hypothetical protein
MAATGGTLLQLYYSTTNGNVPLASNLAYGELAINAYNGKLYYKNANTNAVTILADGAISTGNLPGGSAGSVVYQSATGVTAYLPIGAANSLLYSNGTGPAYATLGSAGAIVYTNGTAPTSLALGTSGYVLTAGGSAPTYVNPASLTVGTAASAGFATSAGSASTATLATSATNVAGGTTNQVVYQSGVGATAFVAAPTVTGTVLGWNGSQITWVSAPAATTANSISGGAQYQIPFQSGVSTTTFSSNLTFNSSTNTLNATNVTGTAITASAAVTGATLTANAAITGSAATGAINYGTLSYSDVNIFSSYATSVNGYAQKIIQNTNSGSSASVDFIVSNNLGTASTYYGDFGMNSSTYSGTGPFQAANVVYMYSISTDLVIGTKSSNYLRLVTNDNAADSVTISPTNAVAFNGNYGVSGQVLQSNGTASAPTWINTSTLGTSKAFVYFVGQL